MTVESTFTRRKPWAAASERAWRRKVEAVVSGPAGIGIGKVHPDVAQRGCAEDGIGDRVGQHVGVGVSCEAQLRGNFDPAQI